MDYMERTALTVYANGYCIKGAGSLVPGARVTDYLNAGDEFLALIDVKVWTYDGRRVLDAPFLNINRSVIEMVVPQG